MFVSFLSAHVEALLLHRTQMVTPLLDVGQPKVAFGYRRDAPLGRAVVSLPLGLT